MNLSLDFPRDSLLSPSCSASSFQQPSPRSVDALLKGAAEGVVAGTPGLVGLLPEVLFRLAGVLGTLSVVLEIVPVVLLRTAEGLLELASSSCLALTERMLFDLARPLSGADPPMLPIF